MTKINYHPEKNIFVGRFGIYSGEEMEEFDQREKAWISQKQIYSFNQLIDIFPQAKATIKKHLNNEIKLCKKELAAARTLHNYFTNEVIPLKRKEDHWFFYILRDFFVHELQNGREARIKKNCFLITSLKDKPKNKKLADNKTTIDDIFKAKQVPITDLFPGKLNMSGGRATGLCPFHKEDSPSFTIYIKENRAYCFGCNFSGDSIDFIRKQNNCNFIEAVKMLIKK